MADQTPIEGQEVARGWSPHVAELLELVTHQQRAAIPRMALAIIEGRGINALFSGPDKVCNRWTYWHKAKPPLRSPGWRHQPEFQRALDAAVADLRQRTEVDVISASVARIKARLRAHDAWADEVSFLSLEALARLADLMRDQPDNDVDPRQVRAMVAAAKAINDREGRLYEQDKSRADTLLAEKEAAAAANTFLEVMQMGIEAAQGEDGIGCETAEAEWEEIADDEDWSPDQLALPLVLST